MTPFTQWVTSGTNEALFTMEEIMHNSCRALLDTQVHLHLYTCLIGCCGDSMQSFHQPMSFNHFPLFSISISPLLTQSFSTPWNLS